MIIFSTDKDGGVVVQNRADYFAKSYRLLSDKDICVLLNGVLKVSYMDNLRS